MLVSTGRGLEPRCIQVLKEAFQDFDPGLVSRRSGFSGLLVAQTRDPRGSVGHIVRTLDEKPWYNDLIKRAVPIDKIVEIDPEDVIEASRMLVCEARPGREETFRVRIRKRGAPIDRMSLIVKIADLLENPVDLVRPEFELRVEMLRKVAGVSLIRRGEIFPDL